MDDYLNYKGYQVRVPSGGGSVFFALLSEVDDQGNRTLLTPETEASDLSAAKSAIDRLVVE